MSRIRSRDLDDAPIWDDVKTFDGKPWAGVDIISGGFPCQDVSHAGKRAGVKDGTRSGLWSEFHRIICEARPRFVLVENVPGLLSIDAGRGFGRVLGDLAAAGYDAEWCVRSAAEVGAPHLRERVWVVAYAASTRCEAGQPESGRKIWNEARRQESKRRSRIVADSQNNGGGLHARSRREGERAANLERRGKDVCHSEGKSERPGFRPDEQSGERRGRSRDGGGAGDGSESIGAGLAKREGAEGERPHAPASGGGWWSTEPDVGRVAHGVAFRVDRLRCLGNGVVPQQALPAWQRIQELAEGGIA